MWHLDKPSKSVLKAYKDLFYKELENDIKSEPALKILLGREPDNIPILEHLLVDEPKELYNLCTKLMNKLIPGYSESELPMYETDKRKKDKNPLLSKYCILDTIFNTFNYKKRIKDSKSNSYKIAHFKQTNTCVYCNRQYTITIYKQSPVRYITRPNFDHWFPQRLFPLMSLSFYNLIPCCSICNSGAKGITVFRFSTHVHPYIQTSNDPKFKFSYLPNGTGGWKIDLKNLYGIEKTTFDAFNLKDLYEYHYKLEAKDLLDLATKYNGTYAKWIIKYLDKKRVSINYRDAYRILFGVEYDVTKTLDRPFSKLKRDLLEEISNSNPYIDILKDVR